MCAIKCELFMNLYVSHELTVSTPTKNKSNASTAAIFGFPVFIMIRSIIDRFSSSLVMVLLFMFSIAILICCMQSLLFHLNGDGNSYKSNKSISTVVQQQEMTHTYKSKIKNKNKNKSNAYSVKLSRAPMYFL